MINKVILVGRLIKDPEVKSTSTGVTVCNFSVAIPRKFVKQGEERQADFINCIAFRQTADFISRYFTKGNVISLVGSIQTRSWDDNEGKRRWATEVIIDEAGFVESKRDVNEIPSELSREIGGQLDNTDNPDDLPF